MASAPRARHVGFVNWAEVIVGGPRYGLFAILLFAIVAVLVAGLMVGRTPEYLSNKIEAHEVRMTMLALLCVPFG